MFLIEEHNHESYNQMNSVHFMSMPSETVRTGLHYNDLKRSVGYDDGRQSD